MPRIAEERLGVEAAHLPPILRLERNLDYALSLLVNLGVIYRDSDAFKLAVDYIRDAAAIVKQGDVH